MKRLLAIFLLLALLIGCSKQEPPEPFVPDLPEPTPEVEEIPAEEPPPQLMDNREPFGETGVLWYLPNEAIEACRPTSLCLFQGMLLASGERYIDGQSDLQLMLLDLQTGEVIRESVLSNIGCTYLQVCGDRIAVCDEALGNIYLLDEQLRQTVGRKIATEWEVLCSSLDGKIGYRFTMDEGIHAVDLETGDKTVLLPEARMLSAQRPAGNTVCFYYTDAETSIRHTASLDLKTGVIEEIPFPAASTDVSRSDGIWMTSVGGRNDYYIGAEADPGVLDPGESFPSLLQDPPRLKLYRYDEDGTFHAAIHDPDGTYRSGFTISDGWNLFLDNLLWSEQYGGYFLTATDQLGSVQLLFWDFSTVSVGEDLTITPLSSLIGTIPEGSAVSKELYDRAAAIGEQYGVTVNIADRCPTEYTDYTVLQNTDFWQITSALDTLETALASFPDGFFDQLIYSTYRETEINLVGTLTPLGLPEGEITGFDTFSAFAENAYDKHIITLDITQSGLEQTIYHEFSHVIDDKLAFDAMLRQNALYHEETWADLNPENFGYLFDYYNVPDAVYHDGYDAYFVDIYSRTFPTEDRARILEYAMGGWDWVFFDNEPLFEKLRYYAACIRDAFDTDGWPDVTIWEQPLQNT